MALTLFRRRPRANTIPALYGAIVAQARAPGFYADFDVPDTVEGRFDMIVLHLSLLVRRLRSEPEELRALGQQVFDAFCIDMDHNLREMGVGDVGVPRRMRAFGEAFYGRAAIYDRALDQSGETELAAALARNVFRRAEAEQFQAARLAAYVRAAERCLTEQRPVALAAGEMWFPPVEGSGTAQGEDIAFRGSKR